jgi:hypothetical protein
LFYFILCSIELKLFTTLKEGTNESISFVEKNYHDRLKVGILLVVGEREGHFTKHLVDASTIM